MPRTLTKGSVHGAGIARIFQSLFADMRDMFGTDGPRSPNPSQRVARLGAWRSLSSREIPVKSSSPSRDFESASDLSRRLGLPFANVSLLTRALTHRSYLNEN